MNSQIVCSYHYLPAKCSVNFEDFKITYHIEKTSPQNKYRVYGEAISHAGGTKTFTEYSHAEFRLLLVNNKAVVDEFRIAGGTGSLTDTITFSRTFETDQPFEASIIIYSMNVQG